jgi:hypothetical protein
MAVAGVSIFGLLGGFFLFGVFDSFPGADVCAFGGIRVFWVWYQRAV